MAELKAFIQKYCLGYASFMFLCLLGLPLSAVTESTESFVLEEIIVTSRKRQENLQEIPEAITAFSARTIEQAGIEYFDDFAKRTPNFSFNVSFTPNEARITARGIATAQNAELPVAVVVDGIQVSDPAFVNQGLIDVERIEVLRGPQGSLYGRNALAGAINITTKQATNEFRGRVSAGYGDGEDLKTSIGLSGPIIEDKLFYTFSGSYRDFDGLIEDRGFNDTSDSYEETIIRTGFRLDATDNFQLDIQVNYIDTQARSLSSEVGLTFAEFDDLDPLTLSRNLPTVADRELYEVSLKMAYDFPWATLTSISGYSDITSNIFGDGDFTSGAFVLQDIPRNIDSITQELRLTSNDDGALRWLVGMFYQDRNITNDLVIPFDDGSGHPSNTGDPVADFVIRILDEQTSESIAYFAQADYDLTDQLTLTLGLRYDEDERTIVSVFPPSDGVGAVGFTVPKTSKTFSSTQPKISLAYQWTEDFLVYTTYAEGFRSGGFNGGAVPYEDETVKSYELGFKKEFLDNRVVLNGAIFHIDSEDPQFFFAVLDPPSQNAANFNKGEVDGLELELVASLTEGLEINASIGVTDSTIKDFNGTGEFDGNHAPQAPSYEFNFGVQHIVAVSDRLDLRARFDYERRGDIYWEQSNTLKTSPRDLIDLRLFLESSAWSVGIYAENLLDEQYAVDATIDSNIGEGVASRIPSSNVRSYGIQATHRF